MRRISIDELIASRDETFRLRELLGNGGVAALPTETFYGLAADPWSEAGVRRICAMKGRDAVKALPVLFATRVHLDRLGIEAPPRVLDSYFQIWPAPLTVVFSIRQPIAASRGIKKLGVRIPADRKLRRLLQGIGPVTGTSVNRSGSPPLDDPDAVETLFRRDIDWLIDGGRTPGGKPSTVIDATAAPPELLRAGAYAWVGPAAAR
ncbi:MAG: L-threonylcarbamoyladenylate synthase [Acidobacteriota bacterium]